MMNKKLLTPKDLRVYQRKAIRFLWETGCAALFMDMGLGKTICVLSFIHLLMKHRKIRKPVLLIAPIRVMYGVWRQEAANWTHTRKMRFSIIHGSAKQRLQAVNTPADIYLMNPHNLVWLIGLLRKYRSKKAWPFDALIIDESSDFKSAGTKRFSRLRHVLQYFKVRVVMSGTPTPNSLLEIWPQMFIVDMGERLGESSVRFKARFFAPENEYQEYPKYIPRPGAERDVQELIGNVALSMDYEDWLDVPPTVLNNVWVELPDRARTLYDRFEREMFLQLDEGDVDAIHPATLSMRCHQIANGAIYTISRASGEKIWEHIHDAKLEALREIVYETGSPVLVGYWFKHDLLRLLREFPKAPVFKSDRNDRLEREWNDGKHRIAFAHYRSAAHGMNLQHGPGHTIALFSKTWSYELYYQLLCRIGFARAKRKVMVHHIVARRTVDEAMLLAMEMKATGQAALKNALNQYRRHRGQIQFEQISDLL